MNTAKFPLNMVDNNDTHVNTNELSYYFPIPNTQHVTVDNPQISGSHIMANRNCIEYEHSRGHEPYYSHPYGIFQEFQPVPYAAAQDSLNVHVNYRSNILHAGSAELTNASQIQPTKRLTEIDTPPLALMSSSERGKRFRALKHQQISKLVLDVGLLKGKIAELSHVREHLKAYSEEAQKTIIIQTVDKCLDMLNVLNASDQTDQNKHLEFLQEVCLDVVEHVCFATGSIHSGISNLLLNWTNFCKAHAQVEMLSHDTEFVQSHPQVMVHASSILRLQLSKDTLSLFFPQLVIDSQYVEDIVGLQVNVSAKHMFIFTEEGKCISWKTYFEFVPGFAEALGSWETALSLLGQCVLQQL